MKLPNGSRMRLVVVGILTVCCSSLWARPTTVQEAEDLVAGWLKADPKPLGTLLGRQVKHVETFTNQDRESIFYIVYLQPSGFVIVSADDLIEPIIGFVQKGSFDSSPENPLAALVTNDLTNRIAWVRGTINLPTAANQPSTSENQHKWRHFIELANAQKNKDAIVLMNASVYSISDVRVAPLVKSKWGQLTVSDCGWDWCRGTVGEDCPLPCYNYYTPNNYLCGCPATALAQLMRYHEYPITGVGVHEFTITIGWPTGPAQQAFTRGGDGLGGPYNWDFMTYEPNCSTPEIQRQAIGALCYDAGVAMNQTYSATSSGWDGISNARAKQALTNTFMYGNAVHGYNDDSPIGGSLISMINPNLDAKKPVILGTDQHAFVCDGYGYNGSTLYHHLNMGFLGYDDAWYDLSAGTCSPVDGYNWGSIYSCVYNVQTLPAGDGEIISGRVLDHNANPIVHAILSVTSKAELIAETETDDKGIYAFDCLESNTIYTVNAALRGYGFSSQKVTTGISQDDSVISGNLWGVDVVGLFCDFNSDQKVNIEDLIMLIEHWGRNDPDFDVAPVPSGDGIVNVQDMEVLLQYWGIEVEIPEFGIVAHWKLDETDGSIAEDIAGENNGTLHGEPTWQPDAGIVGGALQFNGIDDYVRTDHVLNPADGAFSVFAWIKGGIPGQAVLSQANNSTWLCMDSAEGRLMTELKAKGRGAGPLLSQTIITDGNWHRIGLVWDGSYRHLYVDGAEVVKDAGPLAGIEAAKGGLYFGAGSTLTPGTFWSGLIDDIRIYNRAVSP